VLRLIDLFTSTVAGNDDCATYLAIIAVEAKIDSYDHLYHFPIYSNHICGYLNQNFSFPAAFW